MTHTADYWRRRYEQAEAARLELSSAAATQPIGDLVHQVTALEQLVLDRAALVSIEYVDKTLTFVFTRRGEVIRCPTYATMGQRFNDWRKALLED